MNEDIVTFDIAKKLKEKGFRYNKNSLLDRFCIENQINHPTIFKALKWLRAEKGIHISIDYQCRFDKWYWCAYSIDKAERVEEYSEWIYKDYEEAALAGINYVLDNVI